MILSNIFLWLLRNIENDMKVIRMTNIIVNETAFKNKNRQKQSVFSD